MAQHRADLRDMYDLLLPYAESGDVFCQYALSCMLHAFNTFILHGTYDSLLEIADYEAQSAAKTWWIAAAKQGCWPAMDALFTFGIGEEADQARLTLAALSKERADLCLPGGFPSADTVRELCRRFYGVKDSEILLSDWMWPLEWFETFREEETAE